MPLNRRQGRVFYLVADIYIPKDTAVDENNAALDVRYPQIPNLRGIPCKHEQSQEDNVATVIGRGTGELAENIDHFKFAREIPMEDSYVIHVRSVIEADDGVFYLTSGAPDDRPAYNRRRANQRKVSAKKIPKPLEIIPPPVYQEGLI